MRCWSAGRPSAGCCRLWAAAPGGRPPAAPAAGAAGVWGRWSPSALAGSLSAPRRGGSPVRAPGSILRAGYRRLAFITFLPSAAPLRSGAVKVAKGRQAHSHRPLQPWMLRQS